MSAIGIADPQKNATHNNPGTDSGLAQEKSSIVLPLAIHLPGESSGSASLSTGGCAHFLSFVKRLPASSLNASWAVR
ncbi:MAG TPA: hypothetical protein VF502_14800 [Stellaceae bacterium]